MEKNIFIIRQEVFECIILHLILKLNKDDKLQSKIASPDMISDIHRVRKKNGGHIYSSIALSISQNINKNVKLDSLCEHFRQYSKNKVY